jgi:hypothetical protein
LPFILLSHNVSKYKKIFSVVSYKRETDELREEHGLWVITSRMYRKIFRAKTEQIKETVASSALRSFFLLSLYDIIQVTKGRERNGRETRHKREMLTN